MPAQKPFHPEELDLRTPWLAALLSWLVPGAGQFYQKRYVKAGIFSVCILGTFLYGVALGEGRPVYSAYYENRDGQIFRKRNYGYLSQILLGLPAMPALLQSRRLEASVMNDSLLSDPLEANFEGRVLPDRDADNDIAPVGVTGTIRLQMEPGPLGPEVRGHLVGQVVDTGEAIDITLAEYQAANAPPVGPPIAADPQRFVFMQVDDVNEAPENLGRHLRGTVPRSFINWYQVPLQDQELQDLNSRLGKRWELAMVFTWIAGLLNILCIWDAYEGPAYGIRPRPPEDTPTPPPTPKSLT